MKRLMIFCLVLTGCAINPRIGMSLSEWQDQCRSYSWTSGKMVAADAETEIYTCGDPNTVYAFQNSRLVLIDRVQAPSNPNQASAAYSLIMGQVLLAQ